ncbi:zincin [Auricularia subglabra TFB-10046 SS5]|nr:zincin [Auricularia subglabra TFB-10046 SS5]
MRVALDKHQPPQAVPNFRYTPESVKAAADDLLKSARATLGTIAALPAPERTFENVFGALAALEVDLLTRGETLEFLRDASPDADVRAASQAAVVAFDEFKIEREMRLDLFEAAKGALACATGLSPEDQRFAEKILLEGKRAGLDLPATQREELAKLKKELSALCAEFRKNVGDENGKVTFTAEELDGVPEDELANFTKMDSGVYEVDFKGPEYGLVLGRAKSAETRRKIYVASQSRLEINVPVFDKMLDTRRKIATLLKYDTWADYVTEIKMTKTGKAVVDFLEDLESKVRPIGLRDLEELLAIKREEEPNGDHENMYAWDNSYYSRLHGLRTLQLDGAIVRKYFPVEVVVPKILDIYQEMLGVEFVKLGSDVEKGDVWHPDVMRYAVWEAGAKSADDFVGYAYIDLYPREGKSPGAGMWQVESGYLHADGETRHRPVTAILASLAKPTPERPALMAHWDTVQFFHEMGHVFHGLLSKTKYARFHGTAVNVDFGEAPSQMLENWCYLPKVLERMTSHYETKEPMAADLIEKLIKNRHRLRGLFLLNQLAFSKFDVTVHTDKEPRDVAKLWHEMGEETSLMKRGETPLPGYGGFGHLVHYDVGYYSYAYSEVFSADMFRTVFAKDPFSVEAGKRYRKEILLPGASRDEMETLVAFLGRPPSSDAFLEQLLGPQTGPA